MLIEKNSFKNNDVIIRLWLLHLHYFSTPCSLSRFLRLDFFPTTSFCRFLLFASIWSLCLFLTRPLHDRHLSSDILFAFCRRWSPPFSVSFSSCEAFVLLIRIDAVCFIFACWALINTSQMFIQMRPVSPA